MSIKVTTGKAKAEPKGYPKIMKDSDGLVVLFTSHDVGAVLQGDKNYSVGYHSTSWCRGSFKDYNLPITLENL